MTTDDLNGISWAFPWTIEGDSMCPGMTLRDWFAGQALKWAGHGEWFHSDPASAATRAYKMADAMLDARKNNTENK